jgi:hypothetical protein
MLTRVIFFYISVKSEDEDDAGGKRRGRHDSDIDDIDFEEVFQDDEEVAADIEAEDDETKDVKARVKKETKGYVPGGENVEDFDEEEDISLTSEGKVSGIDIRIYSTGKHVLIQKQFSKCVSLYAIWKRTMFTKVMKTTIHMPPVYVS